MDYLVLTGLALIDGISVGTLLIPMVLLIVWRKMRLAPFATYLTTITLAYFGIGVALYVGMREVFHIIGGATSSPWFCWAMLAMGILLLLYGIFSPTPKERTIEEIVSERSKEAAKSSAGSLAMIGLALGAALIEAASMLPYIAAVGIIETLSIPVAMHLMVLAIYCLVMILPAILVGVFFMAYGDRAFERTVKLMPMLEYRTKIAVLWIAALVGAYMIVHSLVLLGVL
ncbi:MAG: GAP family protein [Corynebacterium sp.]|uniref:GAP family protein n=1 Tax=Corynebacterium sp. TaxID=1720 RepID=UPI0026DC8F4C|nr:GAP family protein [Corynebacterium sp.]MDO5029755.1 GAP family protein [Corynebacterium sp.]